MIPRSRLSMHGSNVNMQTRGLPRVASLRGYRKTYSTLSINTINIQLHETYRFYKVVRVLKTLRVPKHFYRGVFKA